MEITSPKSSRTWLVTGAAGFIGSHIVETLLRQNQRVIGVDNFLSGKMDNIEAIKKSVGVNSAENFKFVEGDICDKKLCAELCRGTDFVLHLAALCSVPLSIREPQQALANNVDGFNNLIEAAFDAKVKRFVYSSSSAVYGDEPTQPKKEELIGTPISPYAITKRMNELTAEIYFRSFGFSVVGLRYFNVFGPRQSPDGPYAAVIPQWIIRLISGESAVVYGDGSTTRDFCPVENVVAANLAAARADHDRVAGQVYNIALGEKTTLAELHSKILAELRARNAPIAKPVLEHEDWREGDIRHSQADISRARTELNFTPAADVASGLRNTIGWFLES